MRLEGINENVSGYGNYNEVYVIIIKATAIYKIALSHIQMVWPIQLKF